MMTILRNLKIQKQRISGLILQTSIPQLPETIQGMINPNLKKIVLKMIQTMEKLKKL